MLTRAFLLAWYTAMMPRVEKVGSLVRSHSKQSPIHVPTFESPLSKDWIQTPIASPTSVEQHGHVLTWINPIDARQVFTDGVAVSACLIESGFPRAGIVHFPLRNETWSVVGDEWFERPVMAFQPPEIVLAPDVPIKGYKTDQKGDLSSNAADVFKGNALAAVRASRLYTWDICALDAIARATNSSFVEWETGLSFNYTRTEHVAGVFVSTTTSREWFRLTVMMRAPFVQAIIVIFAWLGLYLYPEGPLAKRTEAATASVSFYKCVLGFGLSRIAQTMFQERILAEDYDGQNFMFPNVLDFVSTLSAALFASHWVRHRTTPWFQCSIVSAAQVAASLCHYAAVQHVAFPVVAIFKSLQVFAVILVGRFVFGQQYTKHAYLLACALAGGTALCLMSTYSPPNGAVTSWGTFLMVGCILAKGMAFQWQQYLYKTFRTPPLEMMLGVSHCSVLFVGILAQLRGQLSNSVDFGAKHPTVLVHVAQMCFAAIFAQWFLFKTIEQHGAEKFAMILLASKSLSLVTVDDAFRWQVVLGILLVTVALAMAGRWQTKHKRTYAKVPQIDPETGYDSMDEYELESEHED